MLHWLILNCNQILQVNFLVYYNNLVSQVRDLMRPWNFRKYFSLTNKVYWWNRSHFWWWVLLNHAPTSTQLISASTQLSATPSRMQIPNLDLEFWNSDPKTHFWENFGWKSQCCSFFLKIGMHGILTMLILIPTIVFWIANPKSIFGQIWTEKVKVVCVAWNLVQLHIHTVSRRCWFLFWY